MTHHIDFRSELGASKRAGVSRIRNLPREKNINKREKTKEKITQDESRKEAKD